jgi:hypothetical protein
MLLVEGVNVKLEAGGILGISPHSYWMQLRPCAAAAAAGLTLSRQVSRQLLLVNL